LESFVAETRDKASALKFINQAMMNHGEPRTVVAERLRSCGAAMREIGKIDGQETSRRLNNREDTKDSRSAALAQWKALAA
jgi:putative transposase